MIGDLVSKVLFSFEADVTDLKKGIGDVSAAEKKLLDQQIKAGEMRNASMEKWVAGLGTAVVALGAVGVAAKVAFDGVELSARKAQLAVNVNSDALVRLRKGMGGLRTEMQSLEIANKLAQSSYKLTGEQMESVGRAIRQLVREGASWDDASKRVTESIVKLEGEALKDFGIRLREAKTDGDKFAAILDGLAQKSGALSGESRTTAESIVGVKTEFAQAADSMKESLGKIVIALEPLITGVSRLAAAVGGMLAGAANGWADLINLTRAAAGGKGSDADTALFAKYGLKRDKQSGTLYFADAIDYHINRGEAANITTSGLAYSPYRGRQSNVASSMTPEEWARLQKLAPAPRPRGTGTYRPTMPGYTLGANEYGEGGFFTGGADLYGGGGPYDISSGISGDMLSAAIGKRDIGGEYQAFNAARSDSKLAGIFGPIEEFNVYSKAFDTLTGAVGSAFSAWIDGSMSAGEAFKRFVADALKSMAVQMSMEALKHGAYAIGSLAFGNLAGAATHAKAAAAFAAGAISVGIAAKGLGSGGASPGAGASIGGGVPAYNGGGNGQQQGSSQVVVIGQDYSNDSARERQLRAARALELAKQMGNNSGVTYA